MGLQIDRDRFDAADFTRFAERLEACLEALASLLERPGFGVGARTIGAELEVSLVDERARPLPENQEVLAESRDPRLTVELNRFNLESNLRHGPLAGRPFAALRDEFADAIREMKRAAALRGGRVAMVGILPTLRESDLDPATMTDTIRFRALSRVLRGLRDEPFRLDIHGEEDLEMTCEDVTFEGAATSLQLHLRIDPGDFAATFNALQLATAPVLAAAGNSPIFMGRCLWHETRVALFKQAVDTRTGDARLRAPARVSFGRDWVKNGPLELFAESVRSYPPLLPVLDTEDPARVLAAGGVASLRELRLHQGTVWSWNRPVYDAVDGGHVRIEMRALPSGPSLVDMLANTAFLIGLATALAPEIDAFAALLRFDDAQRNFYRAAKQGLDADLHWPTAPGAPAAPVRARTLAERLLPIAQAGLDTAGVEREDSAPLLSLMERRIATGRTGARWQRETLRHLERDLPREEALPALVERYLAHCDSGLPAHEWPLPENA